MKKIYVGLVLGIIGMFMGCAQKTISNEEREVIVFAAASMTETLDQIAIQYKEVAPEVHLVFNYDSSGTLKTQIEEGAECDLFISAAQKQMDELTCVMENTRCDLLENKVVLVASDEAGHPLESFDALAEALKEGNVLLAIGNADVPVGQYTQKILNYYGLDEEELAKQGVITYGSNVKEVTTQVGEGVVDFGIIYGTDAYSAGLTVLDEAHGQMCGQVIYPAALLETSGHKEDANAFLDYLQSEEAMEIFKSVGFSEVE